MIHFHYALQTCDSANNSTSNRYCSNSRSEITKKSVLSFLKSIKNVANRDVGDDQYHNIIIVDDNSSRDTIIYLYKLINYFNCNNININLCHLENSGIMNSIRYCYNWLEQNGIDIVYQVQDDYLFEETAIFEMIDIFMQLKKDCGTESIITGYNDPYLWNYVYRYASTPRTVIPGISRYWIQSYDIACTFLTSKSQFSNNWDLYELFLNMPSTGINGKLESLNLNYMFTKKRILGLLPIKSVALHMGSEIEKDPYIDWKLLWNSIDTSLFE